MTQKYEAKYPQEENYSFRQLILSKKPEVKYLWAKKLQILTVGLIGGVLGILLSFFWPISYTARLTFVVEDSKAGGGSIVSALAGQFGLDLNSVAGASGVLAGDNVVQLLKSNMIIKNALLTPYGDKQNHTLADIYIIKNKLKKTWENKYLNEGEQITFPQNSLLYNRLQDSLLQDVVDRIIKKELSVAKPDKKTSFFEITTTMKDEKLAQKFCKEVLKKGTDFYIQTKTKRLRTNVTRLQIRADSLTKLLNRKTYSASASTQLLLDVNPAYTTANVGSEVKERDKIVLSTIYSEVIKNLEANKTLLMQETPTVQIVDEPNLPLKKNRLKWWQGVMYCSSLFGIIFLIFLLFNKEKMLAIKN